MFMWMNFCLIVHHNLCSYRYLVSTDDYIFKILSIPISYSMLCTKVGWLVHLEHKQYRATFNRKNPKWNSRNWPTQIFGKCNKMIHAAEFRETKGYSFLCFLTEVFLGELYTTVCKSYYKIQLIKKIRELLFLKTIYFILQ